MASVSTHDPYKPGQWAMERIRAWQLERSAGMRSTLDLMNKVGAVGVLSSSRVHGFWWETEKPKDQKWWERLSVPNRYSQEGHYRSAIGKAGTAIWKPRAYVEHKGVKRASPLHREFHDIKIVDWWDLSVSIGIRPMFWPAFGLFLMPELEVLGDYGDLVILWVPKDRFGFSQEPFDCVKYDKKEIRRIYADSFRDIKQPPVIQVYLGDEIRFKAESREK